MNASQANLTMVLLFSLRCLLPLALVMGIGYVMNLWVNRWEAEAVTGGAGTAVTAQNASACWSIIGCDPEMREDCPGFKQQMLPCWLARTQSEGSLPEECTACPLYKETPAFA